MEKTSNVFIIYKINLTFNGQQIVSRNNFCNNCYKLYVPVVTLSTQDNATQLEQLKSGFKQTINWSKYKSNVTAQARSQYLDILLCPRFQVLSKVVVETFSNMEDRTSHRGFFLIQM